MTTKYSITVESAQIIADVLVQLPYKTVVKAVQALESIQLIEETPKDPDN
jgi:hypothetical protein